MPVLSDQNAVTDGYRIRRTAVFACFARLRVSRMATQLHLVYHCSDRLCDSTHQRCQVCDTVGFMLGEGEMLRWKALLVHRSCTLLRLFAHVPSFRCTKLEGCNPSYHSRAGMST